MTIRILLVDDQEDSVSFLRYALEARGHAVTIVGTQASALAEADARPHELLISDLLLPDGDGWELMRQLRRQSAIRGIALSGLGFPADRERSLRAGFSLHLLKPVEIELLLAAIEAQAEIISQSTTHDG